MSYLLLLDGPPESRRDYRSVLKTAGYDVRVAITPENVVELAQADAPYAILVDGTADRDAGIGFVTLLRRHPATADVPILLLVSNVDAGLEEWLESLGGVAVLAAACSRRTLLEEVHYLTTPERCRFRGIAGDTAADHATQDPREQRRGRWLDERMQRTWGGVHKHR